MYTKLRRNTGRISSKLDAISLPHKRRKIPTEICLGCSLLNPFFDEWSKWMSRCFVISFPQPHGFAQKCVESRAREKPKESVVDYNVSFPLTTLNYTHTHTWWEIIFRLSSTFESFSGLNILLFHNARAYAGKSSIDVFLLLLAKLQIFREIRKCWRSCMPKSCRKLSHKVFVMLFALRKIRCRHVIFSTEKDSSTLHQIELRFTSISFSLARINLKFKHDIPHPSQNHTCSWNERNQPALGNESGYFASLSGIARKHMTIQHCCSAWRRACCEIIWVRAL